MSLARIRETTIFAESRSNFFKEKVARFMPSAKSAIWNRAEEIVYLLKEGWTLDRLAEKYECHPRTISAIKREVGLAQEEKADRGKNQELPACGSSHQSPNRGGLTCNH